MSEEALRERVERALSVYEKAIQHSATRARQMIVRLGEVKALSQLVRSGEFQSGFTAMCKRGLLDDTFEAIVIEFGEPLFAAEDIEAARWRLDQEPNQRKNKPRSKKGT